MKAWTVIWTIKEEQGSNAKETTEQAIRKVLSSSCHFLLQNEIITSRVSVVHLVCGYNICSASGQHIHGVCVCVVGTLCEAGHTLSSRCGFTFTQPAE